MLAYIRGDTERQQPIGRCRTHDTGKVPSLPQKFHPFNREPANKRVTSNGSPHSPSGTWWHILRPSEVLPATAPSELYRKKKSGSSRKIQNWKTFSSSWNVEVTFVYGCVTTSKHVNKFISHFCRLKKKNFVRERHWEVKCFNTNDFIQGLYLYVNRAAAWNSVGKRFK